MNDPLQQFAADVGSEGPVRVVGGRTQWDVGGTPAPDVRELSAPAGVVAHEPAEMIVRVRAGTTLEDLRAAVHSGGQDVALEAEDPTRATVGGILAVGHSGYRRLGLGPVRDAVLEVTAVSSRGELIRAGAPLVKNVTGFDLCRLLVGSLGTLALLGEIVLRCRPRSELEAWWVAEDADPFVLADTLYRPLSVLWDGNRTWVGLAGYEADVHGQAHAVLGPSFERLAGPPVAPGPVRRSRQPLTLRDLPRELGAGEGWLAEVGVGVVHCTSDVADRMASPPAPAATATAPAPARTQKLVELHRAIKERFDPGGRLNPGRSVLAATGVPEDATT